MLKTIIVATRINEVNRKNSDRSGGKSNVLTENCSNWTKSKNCSNLTKSKNPTKSNYIADKSNFLTLNTKAVFT